MKGLRKIERKFRELKYRHRKRRMLLNAYESLLDLRTGNSLLIDNNSSCECILFSKDRAMQLHALLSSYYENAINPAPIHLLYTYSDERHKQSYDEIKESFVDKKIDFIFETNFKKQILDLIKNMNSSKFFFLNDDTIIKEKFDVKDFAKYNPLVAVSSLLKGLDQTRNTTYIQELPQFIDGIISDSDKKCWVWESCPNSPDWSYPLSVGGNLFSTKEMAVLLDMMYFKGPNTLEGNLNKEYSYLFKKRYGICYNKTIIGSIPCNIVSSESGCLTTGIFSVDELLEKWNNGYRIKHEDFYGKNFDDIIYAKFQFVKRD